MGVEVSVVIPVYGVERYLQECIDSLINQTYQGIELIFVNDASPDNSLCILRENEKRYPEIIKIIDSPENRMQGGARNLGVKAAQGEYIAFCDADDTYAPDMIESMITLAKESQLDIVFVPYYYCEHGKNTPQLFDEKVMDCANKELTLEDKKVLITYSTGGIWCGLWKKKLIIDNQIMFPEHVRYEDNYWGSLIKCYAHRIGIINEPKYFWRVHQKSTIHSNNKKYHYDRITIEKKLLKDVKRRGLLEDYYEAFEYLYISRYALGTYNVMITRFDKPDYDTISKVFKDLNDEFPKWKKNRFYKEKFTNKQKILNKLIFIFPKLTSKVILKRS